MGRKLNGGTQMGRPEKVIDWRLFEDLCSIHCTQQEIAHILHIHIETLRLRACKHYDEKDFSAIYTRFTAHGKMSLRRAQFNLAKKSASMAIWLGKHWLDQKENINLITASPENTAQLDKLMSQISGMQRLSYGNGNFKTEDMSEQKSLKSA
jgi:hypothetical protein